MDSLVEFVVDFNSKEIHIRANALTYLRSVLANSSCEQNSVKTVHSRSIRADVLLYLVLKHFRNKFSSLVTVGSRAGNIPVVGRNAGYPQKSRLLVHVFAHFLCSKAVLFSNKGYGGGVNASCSCTHYNSVKRCKAHGSVDRFSSVDSSDRGAVAEVTGNDLQILYVLAHCICKSSGNKPVRSSVEAVFSDVIFFVIIIRKSVHKRLFGHCLVESGIEHNYLRNVFGENLFASPQRKSVRVVMYRCKILKIVYLLNYLIGNKGSLVKNFRALNYSVTYRGYFVHRLDNRSLSGRKHINKLLKSFCMSGEITVHVNRSAVESLMGNVTSNTYSVAVSLGNNAFVIHVEKLIFERGASRVYYKN